MALRRGTPPSDKPDRDSQFSEYYAARGASLRASAYLLCGDWHLAGDLTQTALTKLYLTWHRVRADGAVDAYARQIIFRAFVDDRRRPWRRERVTDLQAAGYDMAVPPTEVEDRVVLLDALAQVPPRQRATLVLRFWEDLSVEDTADVLGCTPGTVKSQCARGLQTLRSLLDGALEGITEDAGSMR